MDIRYEEKNKKYDKYIKLDTSRKNILIIGKGETKKERNNIINPINIDNAYSIYGESDLYNAYECAYNIINDINIYTVNCYTTDDFFNIIKKVVQYDFNFIVPIGINFRDIFYDSSVQSNQYYSSYILNLLYKTNSLSTLIMTDKHASLYEDMDHFLYEQKTILKDFKNKNELLLKNVGSNLIFSLNMINNIEYSNVVLASLLSINDSSKYLNSLDYTYFPVYDYDSIDIEKEYELVYYKQNYLTRTITVENLYNLRNKDDIYKNVLIDELIKKIIRVIDLDYFKGRIYTRYTKTQVEAHIHNYLKPYDGKIFKSYKLKNVRFIKLNSNSGYIYIELSIVPYGMLDSLNIIMEV